jgi:hypothetical protein
MRSLIQGRRRYVLAAFVVAGSLVLMGLAPAGAATSDVSLTVKSATNTGGVLQVVGTVSCPSTPVPSSFGSVVATVRQGRTQITSSIGGAECDPSVGSGNWGALFFSGDQLHAGQASVDVALTLPDGTVVTTTGSVLIPPPTKPVAGSERVDATFLREDISNFCSVAYPDLGDFVVQEHDVGLEQFWIVSGITGAERWRVQRFVGTVTYTNLANGTSVELRVAGRFRVKLTSGETVFTGLNFEIRTASGQLVSSGRGVQDFTGEQATPHLTHESEVLCPLLA